ncbi:hypothetical protein EGW08_013736 [Elysia chlorotica]|uniref:Mos1 transposase HTH domain-containing protein n=1 Tax=Elysia chlorotica TaxID=188477 RepID=A0A3S1B9R5_ELYCH|nr:hypothetical protein EGW08_013736 [Elysia chlorotica]
MVEVYAEKCPNYSTVTHWVRKFKSGFLSVMDEPREGRPTSVVTEKNVSTVEGLVKQDRRITVKQLASETRISVGSVEKILHDHLNLNKVSARWVPRLLTADQKKERADCCKHLLWLEANDDLFFQKIVTMDETWIYQFDPEPKNASMQWKRPSSPPPKKAKVTQSSGKVMLSCFWDCEGIIMTDYMEKGKTITREYYSGLLKRLRSELVRRRRGKLRNGVLLLHDNAPAHRARQAVETADQCNYEILPHPPYSPDLAPSDFCLFPNLKKSIKGRRFEDIEGAISAVEEWFQAQNDTFYSQGLLKVKDRWQKCTVCLGGPAWNRIARLDREYRNPAVGPSLASAAAAAASLLASRTFLFRHRNFREGKMVMPEPFPEASFV